MRMGEETEEKRERWRGRGRRGKGKNERDYLRETQSRLLIQERPHPLRMREPSVLSTYGGLMSEQWDCQ